MGQSNTNQSASLSTESRLADKTLIIFDWDGTLMDSIGLIVESMHVAGEAHGFQTTDQEVKDIIGLSLLTSIDILYPEATATQKLAIETSYTNYYIPNSHRTPFFQTIEAMLQTLQQQGKQLAVATGKKRRGLDRVLEVSNSAQYFKITRCADESGSKPNPQMLTDILEHTQKNIADAVFIGDSIYDIQMASQLGMTSIAVNYGAAASDELAAQQPSYQVESSEELVELLCG
ncbi:HAD-IA family hydrolase [Psychrobacter frigidicola]|uniref:HAD-IA family hydrolase n=1 Tax=Psychrobacter frigidicola TaxID=45611 RepID=A0A5C7A0V3_9GAMM|nr:HAD-IA family hydrolase [Psychrobacter frigidicola]TXD97034.1 HAD-IA family hydrolase [Psychrobacter frigidicola]